MHNHSYENDFNLHVNEISFSYERMSTKTRFEKEAKGNSEMAYYMANWSPMKRKILLIPRGGGGESHIKNDWVFVVSFRG